MRKTSLTVEIVKQWTRLYGKAGQSSTVEAFNDRFNMMKSHLWKQILFAEFIGREQIFMCIYRVSFLIPNSQ